MKEKSLTKLQERLITLLCVLWGGQGYMQQVSGQNSPNTSFDFLSKHSDSSFVKFFLT